MSFIISVFAPPIFNNQIQLNIYKAQVHLFLFNNLFKIIENSLAVPNKIK